MFGKYSAYSGGPVRDTTPKDMCLSNICGPFMITDTGLQNTPYGPPYQIPDCNDSCVTYPEVKEEK